VGGGGCQTIVTVLLSNYSPYLFFELSALQTKGIFIFWKGGGVSRAKGGRPYGGRGVLADGCKQKWGRGSKNAQETADVLYGWPIGECTLANNNRTKTKNKGTVSRK